MITVGVESDCNGATVIRMTNSRKLACCLLLHSLLTPALASADSVHENDRSEYRAPKANASLTIDGVADEAIWEQARWQDLAHRWLGPEYSAEDFQGRYKVVWTED